MKTNTNVKYIN